MRRRPFAYSEVFCHRRCLPALTRTAVRVRDCSRNSDPLQKRIQLHRVPRRQPWFTTWSQAVRARSRRASGVAISTDMGRTWSKPVAIVLSTADERMRMRAIRRAASQRIYFFFFAAITRRDVPHADFDAAICISFTLTTAARIGRTHRVDLPDRDISVFSGRFHDGSTTRRNSCRARIILPLSMFQQTIRNSARG